MTTLQRLYAAWKADQERERASAEAFKREAAMRRDRDGLSATAGELGMDRRHLFGLLRGGKGK